MKAYKQVATVLLILAISFFFKYVKRWVKRERVESCGLSQD